MGSDIGTTINKVLQTLTPHTTFKTLISQPKKKKKMGPQNKKLSVLFIFFLMLTVMRHLSTASARHVVIKNDAYSSFLKRFPGKFTEKAASGGHVHGGSLLTVPTGPNPLHN